MTETAMTTREVKHRVFHDCRDQSRVDGCLRKSGKGTGFGVGYRKRQANANINIWNEENSARHDHHIVL